MPAKDTYHDAVKDALIRDGGRSRTIRTRSRSAADNVFVDLGAERPLAAERGRRGSPSRSRASWAIGPTRLRASPSASICSIGP